MNEGKTSFIATITMFGLDDDVNVDYKNWTDKVVKELRDFCKGHRDSVKLTKTVEADNIVSYTIQTESNVAILELPNVINKLTGTLSLYKQIGSIKKFTFKETSSFEL